MKNHTKSTEQNKRRNRSHCVLNLSVFLLLLVFFFFFFYLWVIIPLFLCFQELDDKVFAAALVLWKCCWKNRKIPLQINISNIQHFHNFYNILQLVIKQQHFVEINEMEKFLWKMLLKITKKKAEMYEKRYQKCFSNYFPHL